MAHPKKRKSSPRQGNVRRNIGLDLPATQVCPTCKHLMVQHQACPTCGEYRGRAVASAAV